MISVVTPGLFLLVLPLSLDRMKSRQGTVAWSGQSYFTVYVKKGLR